MQNGDLTLPMLSDLQMTNYFEVELCLANSSDENRTVAIGTDFYMSGTMDFSQARET